MNITDWIPALSSTSLLAAILWLARNLITTRLTKAVEHEFNTKIEQLRADLRAKENEISSLRSGALTAMGSRQISVDKRRLEAIDQIWSTVISLSSARVISKWMSVFRFDKAASAAENDPRVRQLFEKIGGGLDLKSLGTIDAQKARPFVTPMAWATYSAFLTVVTHAVARWNIIQGGLGNVDFFKTESINMLLKKVLPHQAAYIDKYGPDGYHHLLEELENKLLQELQSILTGAETDKDSVRRAADIIKLSNDVLTQANNAQQGVAGYDAQGAPPPER